MNRNFPIAQVTISVTLFFAIVIGVFFFFKLHKRAPQIEPVRVLDSSSLYEPGDRTTKVYIKAVEMSTGRLFNLQRTIYQSKDRVNQMRQVLLDYFNGPRTGPDQVPVPEGLHLNDFYLTAKGEGVVDISTSQISPGDFGFYEEVLFIRGLIGTLCQNFFEIKEVKILVDGMDVKTLGGHYALGTEDLGGPVVQTVNSF